jgi:hypothetical protein
LIVSGLIFENLPAQEPAVIKIDFDRKIGEVNPNIYGSFIEPTMRGMMAETGPVGGAYKWAVPGYLLTGGPFGALAGGILGAYLNAQHGMKVTVGSGKKKVVEKGSKGLGPLFNYRPPGYTSRPPEASMLGKLPTGVSKITEPISHWVKHHTPSSVLKPVLRAGARMKNTPPLISNYRFSKGKLGVILGLAALGAAAQRSITHGSGD